MMFTTNLQVSRKSCGRTTPQLHAARPEVEALARERRVGP